jgi:putative endonuclease
MFYTYALSSLTATYIYVGLTENLERRVGEHQSGKNKTTSPYRPFVLVHFERHDTRIAARAREKYLKTGVGREYLQSLPSSKCGDGETCLTVGRLLDALL